MIRIALLVIFFIHALIHLIGFAKVNTVAHPKLAEKYNLKGLPTLLLFHNGNQVKRYAGALSYHEIQKFINE